MFSQKIIQKIIQSPPQPGIYIFFQKKKPIYVGKAANLNQRLKSYLNQKIYKNQILQKEADDLKYQILRSEIEALLVESKLIKELKPTYNIFFRDDKTYFYVAFSQETFPKIFIVHRKPKFIKKNFELIGPFTEGTTLRKTLKALRRIFPYCSCLQEHFRSCLNAQIGNCFDFCCQKGLKPTKIQIKKYLKNIEKIKRILLGQIKKLPKKLFSLEERKAFEKILAHQEFVRVDQINSVNNQKFRIEGYDISHLSGKESVGVMTVFLGKEPQIQEWRKFKIKKASPGNDPEALVEVLKRRLAHQEWPYPDLMIIDGGLPQFKAVKKVMEEFKLDSRIKVLSFAKPRKLVYGFDGQKPIFLGQISQELKEIIPKVIEMTHRWAVKYHRQLRKKLFFDKINL